MRGFVRPGLWLGLWMFGLALCVALSLLPPIELDAPGNSDKYGHLLAYFTMTVWAVQIFRRQPAHVLAAVGLFMLGAAIEWAQANLTTTRHGDPADLLANTLGILLGMVTSVSGAWLQNILVRLDDRLFHRR